MDLNEIEDKILILTEKKVRVLNKLKQVEDELFLIEQDLNVLYDLKTIKEAE